MYSRISSSKDGRAALRYCEGSAHNGNGKRNLLITAVNLLQGVDYADQMERLWRKSRKNHTTQVQRIVISFSKKELDPNNEANLEIANNIVTEFINTYYPHRQCVCYFQNDGKSGNLHAHCIVNDCDLEFVRACTKQQHHYKYVRRAIDSIASKYFELDSGEKSKTKQSQTERVKCERANEIRQQNKNLNEDELRNLLIEEKAYSYKEDIKHRINLAKQISSSITDFISNLRKHGIEAVMKKSSKYGEYFTYDFFDCPMHVKNSRARSYKLGDEYSPTSIEKYISNRITKSKNNIVSNSVNNNAHVSTQQKSTAKKKQDILKNNIEQINEILSSLSVEKDEKQQALKRQQRISEELNISSSKNEKEKTL